MTTKQQRNNNRSSSGFAFLGNRHPPDLWRRLLPATQAKLVEAGLFTADGRITDAGRATLKDMELTEKDLRR